MIVKDKNVPDGLNFTVYPRQKARLLHDEKPSTEAQPPAHGRRRIEITVIVRFPNEWGRERRLWLRQIISIHACHRTTAKAPAATTRARDLRVTLKVSLALLLSVERRVRSASTALRSETASSSAQDVEEDANYQSC